MDTSDLLFTNSASKNLAAALLGFYNPIFSTRAIRIKADWLSLGASSFLGNYLCL